ncbi:hypothetical protein AQUCO_01100186v1 [Aquilegia coerulea]|uniref:Neprosin PEP catalytic domain-containing protein n=1 Tax=Aquilegia coerulea TaxID=218851 RepID=A0A2G5E5X6_AQUCA|nr:hypothetical protein AQUCO_01100186v1 [Aquilegia coerulea]
MKPDATVQKVFDRANSKWGNRSVPNTNWKCPEGTVPIGRNHDLNSDVHDLNSDVFSSKVVRRTGYIYSGMRTKGDTVKVVHGASANMSVWNPSVVLNNEYSGAGISLESGQGPQRNYIKAGWAVNPRIYGDHQTRLFTVWTVIPSVIIIISVKQADDHHSTGCFNTHCQGFIVTDSRLALDHIVFPTVSKYRGAKEIITYINIAKDTKGNWWLSYGYTNVIGYWPREIFTSLGDGASTAIWAGEVFANDGDYKDPFPVMGSGFVWEDHYNMAAYFENMEFVNSANSSITPDGTTVEFHQNDFCYYAAHYKYSEQRGFNFMYGGPNIDGCW